MYDLVLTNGRIVDGSGSAAYNGAIGIKDGVIAGVGPQLAGDGAETIDLAGACVSPGFIDAHTHDDVAVLNDPDHSPKLLQGVTTVVLGNCGHGCAPLGVDAEAFREYEEPVLGRFAGRWDWKKFDEYVERLTKTAKTLNTVTQVPHGAVRAAVMGFEARPASDGELAAMEAIVEEAMAAGAVGMSLGLMYSPGCYSDERELIALGKAVSRGGGILNCHLRSEGDALKESLEEFFRICRSSDVPANVSHLKSVSLRNHGRIPSIVEWFDELRAQGEHITCDVYPYPAGSTTITSLVPPWAIEGGVPALLKRLRDAGERARIKRDLAAKWGNNMENHVLGTGYDRIMACGFRSPANTVYEGRSLADIAEARKEERDECLLRLIEEEEGKASIILFQMDESDVRTAIGWRWSMIGSDGLPLDTPILHPRHYGTFPRVLARYVREAGLLTLEEAVRKMSALPAERFNLKGRGRIAEGYRADLVVFRADEVEDTATFEKPRNYPKGFEHVLIDGRLAVRSGALTGIRTGRHLCGGGCSHPGHAH